MKRTYVFLFALVASGAYAQGLSGIVADGSIVEYDGREPPPYVSVKTKGVDSAPEDIRIFKGEECRGVLPPHKDFTSEKDLRANLPKLQAKSYVTCTSGGKSPLAGTRYNFKRHVRNDCAGGFDRVVYECVRGCSKQAPRELISYQESCDDGD
jgi:hypothetical protein